jgi:uncharacterized protein (DUF885 family)
MSENFQTVSERIVKGFLEINPAQARYIGLHEYDGKVADSSRSGMEARVSWANRELEALRSLDQASLSEQEKFDYALLEHNLEAVPFNINDMREWEENPLFYNQQIDLVGYLSRSYAPLSERLEALTRHQRQLPDYFAAARSNLKPPFAGPVMEVALRVYQGQLSHRRTEVAEAAKSPEISPAQRNEVEQVNQQAMAALQEFIDYLKAQAGNSHTEFAIGRDKYQRYLRHHEMLSVPVEEVLAAGERDLEKNYAEFEETARRLDPKATPDEVRERLKHEHPSTAELIPYTEKLLEEIRTFLFEKDLITVPGEIRPIVAPTPPQSRWSFASMATPGPFEKATEAYYYITLPEEDWTPEQQEEWLTAYSYTTMEDISIHEVYPGHYIHFLNVKQAPSFVTKALRGSVAHSEGWAHYCEQMMLEEGYGGGKPEVKLAQLDAALKRDCRYIAAIKMHTQGMSVDEATRLFMKYSHMAELPARQEALRGTWQPGYLAYTLGKLMLLRLREDLKARDDANFNLKAFHNACVGNGVPPVPLLRRKLLGANDQGALL